MCPHGSASTPHEAAKAQRLRNADAGSEPADQSFFTRGNYWEEDQKKEFSDNQGACGRGGL